MTLNGFAPFNLCRIRGQVELKHHLTRALVGGASLKAADFLGIAEAYRNIS
ncbi:hypothetical protein [Mesorhizobium sp. M0488]|uniref:hypothetical protein n=1 Tax=unclassified Mesorhizobium TaxID=325217 RepID=UPI0033380C4D